MKDVAVAVLLAISVLGALLSALGIISAKNPFDRLHYLSPAAIVVPIPLVLAVVLQNGLGAQASVQTILLAIVLLATNPVATHALARAFRVRAAGDLRVDSSDDIIS